MSIKAVFLDFYGTVVHEDNEIIKIITERILVTGKAAKSSDIGTYWWQSFKYLFENSNGNNFKTQRELEKISLLDTLKHFDSTENADALSELLFYHWQKPPIFRESKEFFEKCPVPIYVVSNIDTADLQTAINYHNLTIKGTITSEKARSYKPQKEIFEYALETASITENEVLHVGDSLTSDIIGAKSVGITPIWINRYEKEKPDIVDLVVTNLMDILDMRFFPTCQ